MYRLCLCTIYGISCMDHHLGAGWGGGAAVCQLGIEPGPLRCDQQLDVVPLNIAVSITNYEQLFGL